MKELYTREVMAYAANIPSLGVIDGAMGRAGAHSRLCGSKIDVTLNLDDGRVSAFAQEVKACLVGQAAASILAAVIIGASRKEVAEGREAVRAMLAEDAPPPAGKWAAFALLQPVRGYPSRHATALLPFDAVLRAIDMASAPAAGRPHPEKDSSDV